MKTTEHRTMLLHHAHPDRARLVWESAHGPVLVEDMVRPGVAYRVEVVDGRPEWVLAGVPRVR